MTPVLDRMPGEEPSAERHRWQIMKQVPAVAIFLLLGACTAVQPGPVETVSTTSPVVTQTAVSSTTVPTTTQPTTTDDPTIDTVDCPQMGPDRPKTAVGPVFLCQRPADGGPVYGGQLVSRPAVTTAEEAVRAWLAGPTEQEQAAGLQGWDLRPYPWFADSLSFRREGTTLVMEVGQWEPINNLSTSNGSAVFYITLFGTVFSDPTVEEFELSIIGNSCPVMLGESEWCFPIDWDDLVASLG